MKVICFVLSFIGYGGFISAKNIEMEALPPVVFECQNSTDCAFVTRNCNSWFLVNKKHREELERALSADEENEALPSVGSKVCVRGVNKNRLKSECQKGFCASIENIGATQRSIELWKDRCPDKGIDGSLDGLSPTLRPLILALHSPLGWERQRAVLELGQMGEAALGALPWLLTALRQRNSFSTSKEALCVVGEVPSEDQLIITLGKIRPEDHPAVPLFIEWLKDPNQLYRHSDILKQLSKLGPQAASAMPVLSRILEEAENKGWSDERGVIALEVAAGLGTVSLDLLPKLKQWTERASERKDRFLRLMIKMAPDHALTKKTAKYCLIQEKDFNCRLVALYFLSKIPTELGDQLPLLKKMLSDESLSNYRQAALRAVIGLGEQKAQALRNEVIQLALSNQENVRRQAVLALRVLDPDGRLSLSTLKNRVYQGFPYESQYLWKVIGSDFTQLEMLKSHVYFVTGKTYDLKQMQVSSEIERQLVNCISSKDCANRTSAMAAVVLIRSREPRLSELLVKAMKDADPSVRWDAAGATILLGASGEALKKAWALQDESIQKGGGTRQIDLEDLISKGVTAPDQWQFLFRRFKNSDSPEVIDATLLLAAQGHSFAQKVVGEVLQTADKQKIVSILNRFYLVRIPLPEWFRSYLETLGVKGDSAISDVVFLNKISL